MAEEGESELLCYFCGADFISRKFFLRHHRAHLDVEICGIEMPDSAWEGMGTHESDDSIEPEKEAKYVTL